MWCRGLLLVIALTCTLQREIIAEPDGQSTQRIDQLKGSIQNVLCVIYLSGLQKEDLSEDLLKKLQRHNINIDDLNDEKTIKKCFQNSIPNRNATSAYVIEPRTSNQTEKTTPRNLNLSKISKTNSDDQRQNISNSVKQDFILRSDIENFMNIWITLKNSTDQQIENRTAKERNNTQITSLKTFDEQNKINTQSNDLDLDFIKKMLHSYIAAKLAITLKPYATEKDFVRISKQIKEITGDSNNHNNILEGRVFEPFKTRNSNVSQPYNISDHESLTLTTDAKLNELFTQEFLLNMFNPLKSHVEDKGLLNSLNEQTRNNLIKKPELDSQIKDAEYMRKMFESYIAAKVLTTAIPSTTKEYFDSPSQNAQGFIKNNNDYIKAFMKYISESSATGNIYLNKSGDINDKTLLSLKKDPTLNYLFKQKYQLNMVTPLQNNIQIKKFEQSETVKLDSNSYEHIPTTTTTYPTDIDFRTMHIEDIKKILDCYVEAKQALAVTLKSTTTEKQIDIFSLHIKELFKANNDENDIPSQVGKPPKTNNDNFHAPQKNYSVNPQTQHKTGTSQSINELVDENKQSMYDLLNKYDRKILDGTSNTIQRRTYAPMQKSVVSNKEEININDPLSKNLNIYKMIERFLATNRAQTSTTIPTTTQKQFDLISQKINEFLEKNRNDNIKNHDLITQVSERNQKQNNQEFNYKNIREEPSLYFRKNINYLQGSQIDIPDPINNNLTSTEKLNNTQNVQNNMPPVLMANNTVITDLKPLPDDIIQKITQKLKVSVLEDLKKEMASTMNPTTKEYTTTEMTATNRTALNTTELDNFLELFNQFKKETAMQNTTETTNGTLSQIDQDKVYAATSALQNVIELFQQFKKIKEMGNPKYALTQKKNTKNEFHGPINVLSLLPANFAYIVKTQTAKPLPIYVNRYQNLNINNHVLQTSDPSQDKENEKLRLQARLDELSDFNINPINNIAGNKNVGPPLQSAAIIQTDAIEVPLLGIPVPKSVRAINQNIVVTTKHPMLQFNQEQKHRNFKIGHKPRYEDYKSRNEERFDVKKPSNLYKEKKYHSNSHRQSGSDLEKRYHTELERYSDTDTDRRYTDLVGQIETDYEKRFHTDLERPYEQGHANLQRGRHSKPPLQSKTVNRSHNARSRQNYNLDNFYQRYISRIRPKSDNNRDRLMLSSSKHLKDRFHEKLERPIEKKNNFRNQQNSSREDKRLKVASRQQLSLNKMKKKEALDDTHFKNFLKTQEKVNNMLEKILTQRADDRVHSVETLD